jgi:putative ABC transport system permease protein
MFKNYLKSALRFLKQNRIFAVINAIGLSIALAASFIILLFVINELSFNHCHKNRKQVYRVLNYYVDFKNTMSGTPYVLESALKVEFPQVEKAAMERPLRGFKLKIKDEYIIIRKAIATNSDIFGIFTIPLILGSSPENILDEQSTIVLSKGLSEKLFPGQNPIGKEVQGIVDNKEQVFTVKGVYEDIPENSTFRPECMVNSKWTLAGINKSFNISNADKDWTMNFWQTWVRLSKDCNIIALEGQFRAFETKNISEKPPFRYSLQNLSDVYLRSENVANSGMQGSLKNIRLFSAIALLIVIVAAINYIILSSAVSSARAKEIGVRKTYGAGNNSIKKQLFSESVLLALMVLPVAVLIMWLSLPFAGKLFETNLKIMSSNIAIYILVYLLLTVLIGIASGIYTSAYLSRLRVLDILKNTSYTGNRKLYFRSSLIIVQLIIFCSFVACTFIIRAQYNFALRKDPGYYNTNVIMIDMGDNFKGYTSYINSIKSNPNIIMAAGAMGGLPMQGSMSFMYPNFQNKEVKVKIEGLDVDFNFLKTLGMTILKGRDFSEEFGSDLKKSCILNETAVKMLGITDPVGKMIADQTIIGVVKDFNLHSIHSDIPPLEINLTDTFIDQVSVHYKPGTLKSILPVIESEWKKAAPDRPFHYSTIEDITIELYSTEKNLTTIVSIFAVFTLVIAAFGLFGLTLFVAKTRTKEIGIKKVFGSSERSIVLSFLTENLVLATLASVFSVPVTIYFMNKWLKNFAFKVSIDWWIFVITFSIAAVVVLLTVFFHSYRASRLNPVKALRYE